MLDDISRSVRRQVLEMHRRAPEMRIASSLSTVEIFVALYYGPLLRLDTYWSVRNDIVSRDRLIISKGHGALSVYPILADLGYFDKEALEKVGQDGCLLKSHPDRTIPGIETATGSLGNGLGIGCGMAFTRRNSWPAPRVYVVMGDGEMNEGSVWEAVMFAAHYRLSNIVALIDYNSMCATDYCYKVVDLSPLEAKLHAFGWAVRSIPDGHNADAIVKDVITHLSQERPNAFIVHTIKGRGVKALENDPLCHVRSVSPAQIDEALQAL